MTLSAIVNKVSSRPTARMADDMLKAAGSVIPKANTLRSRGLHQEADALMTWSRAVEGYSRDVREFRLVGSQVNPDGIRHGAAKLKEAAGPEFKKAMKAYHQGGFINQRERAAWEAAWHQKNGQSMDLSLKLIEANAKSNRLFGELATSKAHARELGLQNIGLLTENTGLQTRLTLLQEDHSALQKFTDGLKSQILDLQKTWHRLSSSLFSR
jgi:hypothetical protein